ncbi:hypothetical protein ACJOS4_02400 [Nocardiopsis sp. frass3]
MAKLRAEIDTLKRGGRGGQLANSSLEDGQAVEVRDDTGALRGRFGWVDGAVAIVTEGGDPVTAPTAPTVVPMPSGLRVSWDGALADDSVLPSDFDHVNVHVSTTDGFTPSDETFVVTIPRSAGAVPIAPLTVGTTYYVRLVPVTTGGITGEASAQASGVPAAVTDIAPGAITETHIANDSISTPKLQAEAVTALKIAAEAIEAGHIKAAAVTAAKLEAELVLGTRIIAGTPSGARVELDSDGIRGYNAADELVFVIDDDGNAIFGAEISGSRFTLASGSGASSVIEEASGVVRARVTSANSARAQLAATAGQAEFSVYGDVTSSTTPAGGMIAIPTACQLSLYSDISDLVTSPVVSLTAQAGETRVSARSGTGAEVRVVSQSGWAGILTTPEASTVGQPAADPGAVYAFRRASTDAPTLSLQSPVSQSGAGAGRRSIVHVEGANTTRAYTIINSAARRFYFQGELVSGSTDTSTDGVVEFADTHSLLATRHAPVRTDMVTAPSGTFTPGGNGGVWTAFSNTDYPAITFKTGWSGRVRITITAAAGNTTTGTSTVHFGFALSGASSVSAAVARAWSVRGVLMQCCSRTVYLNLTGNGSYTLTPSFNISSGTVGSGITFYTTFEHSIVVEPLP